MSIILQGSTSGSVTLQEPAVAGTTVLTLPAVTGNVLTDTSPKAGNVLQVVSTTKTDTASTTSTTYSDISGLSVSITPISSNSKILVLYSVAASNDTFACCIQLLRNSTVINIGTSGTGSRNNATLGSYYTYGDLNSQAIYGGTFLDSPATTSATTYKFQFKVGVVGGTAYINRTFNDQDIGYTVCLPSSITVMEIAA
jgi:hypothetical protein